MRLIYLSHPEVAIDPEVPAAEWRLSERGYRRATTLGGRPWPGKGFRAISSPQTRARQTAAALFGKNFAVWPDAGEIDRSSTGYLPQEAYDAMTQRLYDAPRQSADGWEVAADAQHRMWGVLNRIWVQQRDTVLIGHGGFGTLLWCKIRAAPIDRRQEQRFAGMGWVAESQGPGWIGRASWAPFEAL